VQAREHRVSVAVEMERMIVHGICHLRGFDHERSAGAHAIMTSLEGAVRRELVRELGPARWAKVQEISS
jgi:ssRNA-specific RNase YbeY (16S rRNA maturation enzyme)